MRLIFLAAIAIVGSPALSGDCPTPKPLSCEQLLLKAEQRHCLPKETATVTPPVAVPCASSPCPVPQVTVNCPECKPITETKFIIQDAKPPVPHGNWLVGVGPLYSAGWGVQGVAGYKWASGWELAIGPNWIDRSSTSGSVYGCFGTDRHHGRDDDDCGYLQYSVPAASEWGGTALVIYNFK